MTRRLSVSKEIKFQDTVAYLENSKLGATKAPWLLYGKVVKPVREPFRDLMGES